MAIMTSTEVLRLLLTVPLLVLPTLLAQAPPKQGELHGTIAALDTELFDSVHACNLDKFASFFTSDVEFYHDQGGLTVGAARVTQQVKENLCGKVRRELVAGSLEVHPMHGYGAVQLGAHRFYPVAAGSKPTGSAKFIHLWQKKDGAWKITRVISYDHVALNQ